MNLSQILVLIILDRNYIKWYSFLSTQRRRVLTRKVNLVMDNRKKQVLHAVIKDYVATAEPVGSRTIAKKYDLGVSPATIRNEMSDLEEQGYIRQPHTSAGRIPSDKGYRYYVDHLMEQDAESLSNAEQDLIKKAFANQVSEIDGLLKQAGKLLSSLTNYTSMVIKPHTKAGVLEKISLLNVDENHVLVIMLSDKGAVYHRLLELPERVDYAQLQEFEALLQQKLTGLSMTQITLTVMQEIAMQMLWHQKLLHEALDIFEEILNPNDHSGRVLVNGALNMLNQPEFHDIDKVKELLMLLEADDKVHNLLASKPVKNTEIYIGDELNINGINQCSIISTPYVIDGDVAGCIGILGPTRMAYPKVISLVEFMGRQISDNLSNKKK